MLCKEKPESNHPVYLNLYAIINDVCLESTTTAVFDTRCSAGLHTPCSPKDDETSRKCATLALYLWIRDEQWIKNNTNIAISYLLYSNLSIKKRSNIWQNSILMKYYSAFSENMLVWFRLRREWADQWAGLGTEREEQEQRFRWRWNTVLWGRTERENWCVLKHVNLF